MVIGEWESGVRSEAMQSARSGNQGFLGKGAMHKEPKKDRGKPEAIDDASCFCYNPSINGPRPLIQVARFGHGASRWLLKRPTSVLLSGYVGLDSGRWHSKSPLWCITEEILCYKVAAK